MSLTGHVEDLGVAELLYMVGISRRSGLLHLDGRDGEHELLFRTGLIVAARDRKASKSLRELLVRLKLVDDTHLSVLERQAHRQGRPLAELLAEEGVLTPGSLEDQLHAEVERSIDGALALSQGTFAFDLIGDDDSSFHARFGGLVLSKGLDPAKLPTVAGRGASGGLGSLGVGVSLPHSESTRRVELLVDDSSISLPLLPGQEDHRRRENQDAARETGGGRPLVLVAIAWTELGRRLQALLEARKVSVSRPRTASEAAEQVMDFVESGSAVTVIGDATLSTLPGAELLARVKLASRSVRVVLLLDPRGTPARLAAHRERAGRLGVTHVVLLPVSEQDSDAEDAALELAELLAPGPPPSEELEAIHPLPPAPEALPDWAAEHETEEPILAGASLEAQDARLALLLREVLAARSSAELALELLEVAGEYAARVTLWVPAAGDTVRALGVTSEQAAVQARLSASLPKLRLLARDADLPCACLRDGRSRRVPAALAGAGLVAALGQPAARQVAAIPLLSSGAPIACLVLDDAGHAGGLPILEALSRFVAGLSTALGEALDRDRARGEARRRRAAS